MAVLLIAEDDADIREALEMVFTSRGFSVMTAADGATALQEAHLRHPDVVVTDLEMPGMDGLQLCRALRMHPRLRKIPVIMLSGSMRPGDPRTRTAQVCAVLSKPIASGALVEAVQFQLDRGGHDHGVLSSTCGVERGTFDASRDTRDRRAEAASAARAAAE